MPRLFVAIRPPVSVLDRLLALEGDIPGGRWQDDEQLHLTLRFIGEVDNRTAADVVDALAGVHHPAFEIALSGVGSFARKGRIDTLWAGVTPHDALAALHRKVDHALVRLGLPPEGRAYTPHITLARFGKRGASIADFAALNAGLTSEPFAVTHIALYESILTREAARYEVIERWQLTP